MITTLEFLSDPLRYLAEVLRVSRQGLILGVLNSRSKLGKQLKKEENHPWSAAYFFTVNELIRLAQQITCMDQINISWQTALWSLIPFALPLPWGGFIGMSVIKNSIE